MALKLYNTFSRKKEIFKPLKKRQVSLYTCGPTVYDYVHIGNLSSFIMADLIRRYLEYKGYQMKHVKNITDVGHLSEEEGLDKIETAAKRKKVKPEEIAQFYTKAFLEDEKKLNIKKADYFPKASQHIQEMIKLIKILLKKGYAYKTKSGVYFEVAKFKNYGKLSGNPPEKLIPGYRVPFREEKKDPKDFALWIFDPKHLMQWSSPWGKGYPGWHIECSAMSMKYLGKTIDIHTGGEDNIFPHHEAEIAQSEAATGKKFVRFWIHKRHLLVEGKKMSKSLGNFYTLTDLIKMNYSPLAFRFLVLAAHYRKQLNFSKRGIEKAENTLSRLREFLERLKEIQEIKRQIKESKTVKKLISKAKNDFEKYMDDDLNTPKAFSVVFNFIHQINKLISQQKISPKTAQKIYNLFIRWDKIWGLNLAQSKTIKPQFKKKIEKLIKERDLARKEKNWKKADKIRSQLEKMGIEVRDSKEKTIWRIKA